MSWRSSPSTLSFSLGSWSFSMTIRRNRDGNSNNGPSGAVHACRTRLCSTERLQFELSVDNRANSELDGAFFTNRSTSSSDGSSIVVTFAVSVSSVGSAVAVVVVLSSLIVASLSLVGVVRSSFTLLYCTLLNSTLLYSTLLSVVSCCVSVY